MPGQSSGPVGENQPIEGLDSTSAGTCLGPKRKIPAHRAESVEELVMTPYKKADGELKKRVLLSMPRNCPYCGKSRTKHGIRNKTKIWCSWCLRVWVYRISPRKVALTSEEK